MFHVKQASRISLPPVFFVERPLDGGSHAAHGSCGPAVPFTRPVNPGGILIASAKVKIANRLCAELGVELDQCVAYGDSMSDAEIFAPVRVAVAINADHLSGLAMHAYSGGDLRQAYELVRAGV